MKRLFQISIPVSLSIWFFKGKPPKRATSFSLRDSRTPLASTPDKRDSTSVSKWTYLLRQPSGKLLEPCVGRQYGNFGQPEGGFGPEIGFARVSQGKAESNTRWLRTRQHRSHLCEGQLRALEGAFAAKNLH